MAEGERAQERAQRRGRVRALEDPAHPAVPQQRHVIDAVRAGDHPGDQEATFSPALAPLSVGTLRVLIGQTRAAPPVGQREHRDQPRRGDTRFGSSKTAVSAGQGV